MARLSLSFAGERVIQLALPDAARIRGGLAVPDEDYLSYVAHESRG